MEEILQQLLADDLSALKGMRLKAEVPLREAVINDMLSQLLALAGKAVPPSAGDTSDEEGDGESSKASPRSSGPLPPDTMALVGYIKQLSVEMKRDQLVLHLEVEVD